MELLLILKILLRRWWIVLLPVVVAAILVVPGFLRDAPSAGGFNTTIRYTASQVLDAIPERDGDFQDVWLASELAVNAFTDWVRSGSFKEDVVDVASQNGIEVNPAAFGVAADNARSIGQIFLSYPVESDLSVLVNAVIEVLATRSQDYFPQLGGVAAEVEILDEPVINPAPPPLTDRFGALIRLAVALFAGVGLAFLVEYLDPTLRTREDVESLGVPVITSIPR